MMFWQKIGNFFKTLFSLLFKFVKWLFCIFATFFCWLVKTTIGRVITGTIGGVIAILLLYLFIKYLFIGIFV